MKTWIWVVLVVAVIIFLLWLVTRAEAPSVDFPNTGTSTAPLIDNATASGTEDKG